MNFLGHSLISIEIDESTDKNTLYGNFTGDYYKGLVDRIELPEALKEGIRLHRIIDKVSDRKENYLNELLVDKFGIFKGIVSDMFIDHFLSKNFSNLFNKDTKLIEEKILNAIEENRNIFPKDFDSMFKWLNDRNVMSNYKDIDFLERAFEGLARNIRKGEILNLATTELKKNYNLFEEKSIKEFFYVKDKSIVLTGNDINLKINIDMNKNVDLNKVNSKVREASNEELEEILIKLLQTILKSN